LEKCKIIADNFGISLDDLANYSSSDNLGLDLPPKGKHLFGIVTVGDKGQVVIPAKARKIFDIKPGDQVVILGDEGQGLAVLKAKHFLDLADRIKKNMGNS
ncbi:AbrB/MazE/SpoVT family DNA-binding domain-containing protein, partial [Ruminococcus sp.]|uniref:AbrB/MazE/SpoVT family DNA-binding domain-containing protein n=1 Tax=Ruminococcus sp. TaxID=41978 RepID=UPI00386882C0